LTATFIVNPRHLAVVGGLSSVELPSEVYELLSAIARKRGRSIEEVIVESVAEKLDPETRVRVYVKLHEKYSREAEELYAKGDLTQSGEKYWGALTSLLSAVGEREGLPHYTHRDLREIAELLAERTGDPDYSRLFSSAEALHANFYHGLMTKLSFEAHRRDVVRLIQKLRRYVGLE